MKSALVSALAVGFALTQLAAMPAYAETAGPFRAAAPQSFSADDLQRYGLSPVAAERGAALQQQGYQVRVLTPEETQRYKAGLTDTTWIVLGVIAGVIIIAAVVD